MNVTKVLSTDPSVEVRDRSIQLAWVLNEISDRVTEMVTLHISHDKDRKRFYATLSKEKWGKRESGFTSRSFEIGGGANIARKDVARFSKKGLTDFSKEALDALARLADAEHPDVIRILTPSDRSCGCKEMYHDAGCEVYAAAVRSGRRDA